MSPGADTGVVDVTRARWTSTDGACGLTHTLSVMSGKWNLLIVRQLLSGTKRFVEIKHALDGVSAKPLTESLRLLEDLDIVERRAYAEVPPRVEYTLTARGHSLLPVLAAMADWGSRELDDLAAPTTG